jgi:HTH-type transcriptional regulator/antitoxin HigA
MNIKPIKTEQDYDVALERLNDIFDSPLDTPEGEELQVLAVLIEAYEEKHHPIEAPDPIDAIRIRMEEMNFQQKDLVGIIGGKSRVSEVLNRKKRLTVDMIRALTKVLNLPAELLVSDYELR